jgi:hypothetical protein
MHHRFRIPALAPQPLLAWGAALLLWTTLLETVRESGAVPPAEFEPAAPFYAAIPIFATASGLLTAGGLVLLISAGNPLRRRSSCWFLGAGAGVVAAVFVNGLAVPSAVAVFAGLAAQVLGRSFTPREARHAPAMGAKTETLLRLRWSETGHLLVTVFWFLALAAGGLAFLESVFYTSRFVPRLIAPETLALSRAAVLGLSPFIAVEIGLPVAAMLIALPVALRRLHQLRPLDPKATIEGLAWTLGALGGCWCFFVIHRCLGDEMAEIGVVGHVLALGLFAGAGLGATINRRLRGPGPAGFDLAACSYRSILGRIVQYALIPPDPLPGRRIERWCLSRPSRCAWFSAGTGSIIVFGLGLALYPTVEDFRMQVVSGLATMCVATLALALGAIALRLRSVRAGRRYRAWLALALLFAAPSLWVTFGHSGGVGLALHEYSRFGSLAAEGWLAQKLSIFPELGFSPPVGPGFPFHPAGEDRFPTLPDLSPGERPPIIVVVWDGARPDRTSAYGYTRPTTPHLARLAQTSLVFRRAYTMATATTAGVRHLLSGCYSTRFMLATDHEPFLTKELSEEGYDRFVITVIGNDFNGVSGGAFRRSWRTGGPEPGFVILEYPNVDALDLDSQKTEDVLSALRRIRDERGSRGLDGTFVYLHLSSPHSPWFNENPVAEFGSKPEDLYDGELAKADHHLGILLKGLDGLQETDRCILVVTADHGTGLGEHGRLTGFLPYEEQLRVPLVIRIPGFAPREVEDPVGSIDVAPTLINLFRPGRPHRFHGRSLLPLIAGERARLEPRPMVSLCAFRDSYAILDPEARFKLIHHRGRSYEMFYDLCSDPGELRPLNDGHQEIRDRLRAQLSAFLWEGRRSWANPYHYRAWAGP